MSTAIDNWVDGDARTDRQEYFVSVCGPAANSEYTFRTIHKALSKARPGDIITIREGSYEEKVVLDKPVTIRRETSCARENVRVTGGIVIVGELLVEGEVGNNPDENALTQVQGITVLSGIEIRSGQHIRIRDCDICGGYDGIRVLSGKDCVIEHCQVHNTTEGGNGIYLASNISQCIIQSCEIFDHRANGIELKGTKQISIKECHIYRSANGIFMREGCCHVLLNKNTIESSTYFGIHLSNSHGTITECNISNCLSHCVMLSPTSSVYCAGNHFLGTFRIHRDCTAYVAEGDISTQIQGRVDAEGQLQTNIETLALPNEVLFT